MEEKPCDCGEACAFCVGDMEADCSCTDNACECAKCTVKRNPA